MLSRSSWIVLEERKCHEQELYQRIAVQAKARIEDLTVKSQDQCQAVLYVKHNQGPITKANDNITE